MRHGRVREHPLHVSLHQCRKVADRKRRDCDHRDDDRPEVRLLRERDAQHAQHQDERGHLGRARHERRHRCRRALVHVRRPLVERRGGCLVAEADEHHRQPDEQQHVVRTRSRADLREFELSGRAVNERGAEKQHSRADTADDQILEPGFEGADEVHVDRAEDVKRDREPLEPEEERHQVVRLDEEAHPRARGREQGVVLGDIVLTDPLGVGNEDGEDAGACHEDGGERAEPVPRDRVADLERGVPAAPVDDACEDTAGDEAGDGGESGERPPPGARDEHGEHEADRGRAEHRQLGRERQPVDVRGIDHGCVHCSYANTDPSLMAAMHQTV